MEEHTYRLVFHGKIMPGQDPDLVRIRLSEIFKLEKISVDDLFCGSTVIVRKQLTLGVAQQQKQIFEQSGALFDLEPEDDIEGTVENQSVLEQPVKENVGVEPCLSGNNQTEIQSFSDINDVKEDVPQHFPKNASGSNRMHEDGMLSFSLPNILGFLMGALVFLAFMTLGEKVGLKGTFLGFAWKQIIGSIVGVVVWNRSSSWLKRQSYTINPGLTFSIIAVVVVLGGFISMKHYISAPVKGQEKEATKSITQIRLDKLQVTMNAIQGVIMDIDENGDVPFPDTPEQILEFTRKYRQFFRHDIRMLGADLIKDEWGSALKYEHHGNMLYTIASAGPDKTFDTGDDLVITNKNSQELLGHRKN